MQATLISICIVLFLPIVGSISLRSHQGFADEDAKPLTYLQKQTVESLDSIRDRGITLAESGKYGEAAAEFEQGHRKALESGNTRHAIQFLTYLANIKFKLSDHRGAMEYYLEARDLAEQSGNREMAGIALMNISSLYLALGAVEQATQSANTALEYLPAIKSSRYLSRILAHRARLHALEGDMKQAFSFYNRAYREADRWNDVPTQVKFGMNWDTNS